MYSSMHMHSVCAFHWTTLRYIAVIGARCFVFDPVASHARFPALLLSCLFLNNQICNQSYAESKTHQHVGGD